MRPWLVATTIAVLLPLTLLWNRLAVVATDEWAGAVRAMVNLGRHPLAAALGLTVADRIEEERTMWHLVSDLVRTGCHPGQTALDTYRPTPEETDARGKPVPTQPTSPAARPSPAANDTSPRQGRVFGI